jgi:hypothetical protein
MRRIDLLVHAGAPSSRKDDDKYKAQADAYLGFNGKRLDVFDAPDSTNGNHIMEQRTSSPAHELPSATIDPTVFLDDTQLAYAALDSQLQTSSLVLGFESSVSDAGRSYHHEADHYQSRPNAYLEPSSVNEQQRPQSSPPALQSKLLGPGLFGGSTSQASTASPTEPTQSSYLKSPILNRAAKRQRTVETREDANRADDVHQYMPLPENGQPGVAYTGKAPSALLGSSQQPIDITSQGSHDAQRSTSELPTSYSLSDISSESSRARQGISQRSASDPGPQLGSISPAALQSIRESTKVVQTTESGSPRSLPQAPNSSASQARAIHENNNGTPAIGIEKVKGDHKSASQPTTATPNYPVDPETIARQAIASLPMSIVPPPPSPALAKFTTHITPALENIMSDEDVVKAFKPVSISRDIDPLERGHWLLQPPHDMQRWPYTRQLKFWEFLIGSIGPGNAGWGVSCVRERDPNDAEALGIVKVFCWGEVVEHIYLVLYAVSESKVKDMGMQWLDGGGEVVVQMRMREQ